MSELAPTTLEALVKIALVVGGVMTGAAYFVLVERWMAAWIQMRRGPNRVGIPLTNIKLFGLGQPLADGLKMLLKEDFTPAHVNKRLFTLGPLVILISALVVFAVIPFGSVVPPVVTWPEWMGGGVRIAGDRGEQIEEIVDQCWAETKIGIRAVDKYDHEITLQEYFTDFYPGLAPELEQQLARLEPVSLVIAPGVDVGLIFVFALGSIAVYGVILGGWASNNKYSFLGALRSSAQMIAYELPLGLGILGVVLATGSLRLDTIITAQADSGVWFAFAQPLGMVVFVVASFAEAARLPFDLPEAEQELIGGYHTEYSGMRLVMYLTAEFIHMITAAVLIVVLFLGGWHFWGLTGDSDLIGWPQAILRILVFSVKIVLVILFFMVVRWSWPRFRFDQLMNLAWKVMLPLGMVNLVAVAVIYEFWGGPDHWLIWIASGWAVLLAAWFATALVSPIMSDNRPRLES